MKSCAASELEVCGMNWPRSGTENSWLGTAADKRLRLEDIFWLAGAFAAAEVNAVLSGRGCFLGLPRFRGGGTEQAMGKVELEEDGSGAKCAAVEGPDCVGAVQRDARSATCPATLASKSESM